MQKLLLVLLLQSIFVSCSNAQKNKAEMVSLNITSEDSTVRKVSFEWPFPAGPAPVGGKKDIIAKVNTICLANGIDCPPRRQKISEGIWLCSNGKKIKSNSSKLTKLLSEAWDK